MPGDISISFINCAGKKKCMPATRSGSLDPYAISVMESVEAFDAKIVSWRGQRRVVGEGRGS
jgi:hypothetical protein